MNQITFPGLNLKFNISKVAFSIFEIDIYWYAILIVFAFLIGILIYKINDGLFDTKFSTIIDLLIYIIPISIISARMYYIIFNNCFSNNLLQIFNLRSGRISYIWRNNSEPY